MAYIQKYKKSSFPFKSIETKDKKRILKENTTSYQESKNYTRVKNSRTGSRKNSDGSVSTHLMGDDNKTKAFPTLFQDEKGNFYSGGYNEAKRKGEIYEFDSKKEMTDFARKGNWKKK